MDPVFALSPLDGRYADQTRSLAAHFSEAAFIRARIHVERVYLEQLLQAIGADIPADLGARLDALEATPHLIERVKAIEATTRHDVKAIEYAIGEQLDAQGLAHLKVWVHWGMTSEDANNLAYGCMLTEALSQVMLPTARTLLKAFDTLIADTAAVPMLARTHGQPASPTTVGKELAVFAHRLLEELRHLETLKAPGKLNGATGNWHVHHTFFPEVDWAAFSRTLIEGLGLHFEPVTTQIVVRERYAHLFDSLRRANTVLIDAARDLWQYISLGYFQLRLRNAGEVGSSTMPHKINPVQFENAEGNLELANALLVFLSDKLCKSRLQRDLSDSTVLRNMGSAWGYTLIGWQSLTRGLGQLACNRETVAADLDAHWEVLAEALQHALRLNNREIPYEQIRKATQGHRLTPTSYQQLCADLDVTLPVSEPSAYIGQAVRIAEDVRVAIGVFMGTPSAS
jgi:adenylosuccinate lyase